MRGLDFSGQDLSGADLRNTEIDPHQLDKAITHNMIWPDGTIAGLHIGPTERFTVSGCRNITIAGVKVLSSMTVDPTGVLCIEPGNFACISFDAGVPVSLGGSLELEIGADTIAETFQLFDWTGVTPTGRFNIVSDYTWDTSKLYTTGEVTLLAVPEPASITFLVIAGAAMLSRRQPRLRGSRKVKSPCLRESACV
jgi:hypothetical protein